MNDLVWFRHNSASTLVSECPLTLVCVNVRLVVAVLIVFFTRRLTRVYQRPGLDITTGDEVCFVCH